MDNLIGLLQPSSAARVFVLALIQSDQVVGYLA